jgi:hypothetical protein
VTAQQIDRFIVGQDTCMAAMTSQEIEAELNDWYATLVLRPNAGGQGPWPDNVADIVAAISQAAAAQGLNFQQFSYMVGEGSQIPTSVTPNTSNRDLRYVVTWGPSGQTPVLYLSAIPAGAEGGTPPLFLQVISFNPQNGFYNYYQYVNNQDVGNGPGGTRTWSWGGNGSMAFQSATAGQGCFTCHRNGGLNMKELTAPWNNWSSTQAAINPANVPAAVTQDPLFQNLSGAPQLQSSFQSAMFQVRQSWVAASIQNGTVTNVGSLLTPLFVNTTINLAASQTLSASSSSVAALPSDFFLANSTLSTVLGISYQIPALSLDRASYNNVLATNQFELVNTDMTPPEYSQPGATYFSFFVPVQAYEDVKAIQQLVQQNVISTKLGTAALMVDFQNPVFSQVRQKLLPYAQQISSGKADGQDIPSQLAALITAGAQGQPSCDTSKLSQCTAEQQFLFYWNSPSWQSAATGQIQPYLNALGQRIATAQGVSDMMQLVVSRGVQFSSWPGLCNLHEFSLLLPQTSLGNLFVQMNTDGTLSPQASYNGCGTTGATASVAQEKVNRTVRAIRGRRGHRLRASGGNRERPPG